VSRWSLALLSRRALTTSYSFSISDKSNQRYFLLSSAYSLHKMTTMLESNICNHQQQHSHSLPIFFNTNSNPGAGGLFLEPTIPDSFVRFISLRIPSTSSSESNLHRRQRRRFPPVGCFLSVSLPNSTNLPADSKPFVLQNGEDVSDKETVSNGVVLDKKVRARERGAVNNTTKHLWSGAISAMVSRYIYLIRYCN